MSQTFIAPVYHILIARRLTGQHLPSSQRPGGFVALTLAALFYFQCHRLPFIVRPKLMTDDSSSKLSPETPAEPVPGGRAAQDAGSLPEGSSSSVRHRRIALLQLVLTYILLVPALVGLFYWVVLVIEVGPVILLSAPLFLVGFWLLYCYHLLFAGRVMSSRARMYWLVSTGYNLLLGIALGIIVTRPGLEPHILIGLLTLLTALAAAAILGILGFNAVDDDVSHTKKSN